MKDSGEGARESERKGEGGGDIQNYSTGKYERCQIIYAGEGSNPKRKNICSRWGSKERMNISGYNLCNEGIKIHGRRGGIITVKVRLSSE